jgi:predicted amidohydrolase YtcJ
MKAGTYILYTLLVIGSFSFKMTNNNTQIQDIHQLALSVFTEANKNQQAYSALD